MWHTQVVGQDGLFQTGARGHPITRLSTFQPIDDELGNREPVQAAEHTGICPLQTPPKEAKIKNWVVNEFLTVPIAQIVTEGFHEDVEPPLIDVTETSGPNASTTRPNAESSWWGSLL